MKKIEDALWQDYKKAGDQINDCGFAAEGYEILLEERDKIRNELIKLKQIEVEQNGNIFKAQSEDKRDKIRNIISICTFTVTTLVSICTINKTFKFDQESTVTSTLGRNILNGVIPKMLKR